MKNIWRVGTSELLQSVESLSSGEVKRLGEEVAEHYMYKRFANNEVLLRVQQKTKGLKADQNNGKDDLINQ